jgi:hypothetical protein
MARPSIVDIARELAPGSQATAPDTGDDAADYAAMVWHTPGIAKPTLAQIVAGRATVQTAWDARERAERMAQRLYEGGPEALVKLIQELYVTVDALHGALRSNNTVFNGGKPALPTNWNSNRNRLTEIVNNTP